MSEAKRTNQEYSMPRPQPTQRRAAQRIVAVAHSGADYVTPTALDFNLDALATTADFPMPAGGDPYNSMGLRARGSGRTA